MNSIKGLIIKDLSQLKSYKRTLIIFIAIFVLTGIAQENTKGIGNMLVIMLTLGFGMFSIASFNYDEQAKADRYILTFPLTKKEIVISKYILVIGSTIIGAIVGTIISFAILFIINKEIPNIQELIAIALGGILGLGIVEGIQIPCIYKWGAEKGRIQLFIVVAAVALFVTGIFYIGKDIQLPMNSILNIINSLLPIILILATVIIYYISYRIAYKIYSKKEV
ncbi:MAG TPA: ABC-2 transporter permease [Clostridiaceae bacterium]|nr:ABC-2 transporter permease [Clostridiaceae bacterium]